MTFTPEQITPEPDWSQTPDPGADRHWWRIDLPTGRTGWVWIARSVPEPDVQWIADELNRHSARLGRALEGQLISSGFHLAGAPRASD